MGIDFYRLKARSHCDSNLLQPAMASCIWNVRKIFLSSIHTVAEYSAKNDLLFAKKHFQMVKSGYSVLRRLIYSVWMRLKYLQCPVWPDVGVKSSPIFSESCPKSIHQFNTKGAIFHNIPKLLLNIWATFARNFVPKEL